MIATGTLVNSGFLTGKSVEEAKKAIIEWLEEKGVGTKKTNFKLRDWVFSRQRYWGEPIPIVKCEKWRICSDSGRRTSIGTSGS